MILPIIGIRGTILYPKNCPPFVPHLIRIYRLFIRLNDTMQTIKREMHFPFSISLSLSLL